MYFRSKNNIESKTSAFIIYAGVVQMNNQQV